MRPARSSFAFLAVLALACAGDSPTAASGPDDSPPPPPPWAGEYVLTHLAWTSTAPMAPVPTWIFHGRIEQLAGSVALRADGRLVTLSRFRLWPFDDGEPVEQEGADSTARWEARPDGTAAIVSSRGTVTAEARLEESVLTIFFGGFGSGVTARRYQRR